jgi:hypothetical protein
MDKITPDNVKLKDWISVGLLDAVVCHIYTNEPNKFEVVYLDRKNLAINEDVQYKDGVWTFVYDGPGGGYADKSSALGEFVSILRAGRWR